MITKRAYEVIGRGYFKKASTSEDMLEAVNTLSTAEPTEIPVPKDVARPQSSSNNADAKSDGNILENHEELAERYTQNKVEDAAERKIKNRGVKKLPQHERLINAINKSSTIGALAGGVGGMVAAGKITDKDRRMLDALEGVETTLGGRRIVKRVEVPSMGALGGILGTLLGSGAGSAINDLVHPDVNMMIPGAYTGGALGIGAGIHRSMTSDTRKIQEAMKDTKLRAILKRIAR